MSPLEMLFSCRLLEAWLEEKLNARFTSSLAAFDSIFCERHVCKVMFILHTITLYPRRPDLIQLPAKKRQFLETKYVHIFLQKNYANHKRKEREINPKYTVFLIVH